MTTTDSQLPPICDLRVGHGFDVHRLEPIAPAGAGRPLVLCGVHFESEKGPVSHSDGDAPFHAVTDALLGALALPDIGQLFPDTDEVNEGEDSSVFLDQVVRRVREMGWEIGNCDCTIVLQQPKISPMKEPMRENLAHHLGVRPYKVNIKGRTGELVDAVGAGDAIHVHAVVLLIRRIETKRPPISP